jgi:hypothetical protein
MMFIIIYLISMKSHQLFFDWKLSSHGYGMHHHMGEHACGVDPETTSQKWPFSQSGKSVKPIQLLLYIYGYVWYIHNKYQ